MALEGALKDFGLADILQLIYFQKKSGILNLNGRNDQVQILFHEGNVLSAETQKKKKLEETRIEKLLVKKGLLKESDLEAVLMEQKTSGARVWDILLSRNLVEKDILISMLSAQVTETVVQLFSWKEGIYKFEQQAVVASTDMPIVLDTQQLLMDGLRVIDEWSQVTGKIAPDTIFRKTAKKGMELTSYEEVVLKFIDGENDVRLIIDLSGVDDLHASKAFEALTKKGAIEPVAVAPVVAAIAAAPVISKNSSLFRTVSLAVVLAALVLSLIAFTFDKADSFKKARTTKEIDGLRFWAEVYKYRNGSYPDRLDQIGGVKDEWGRPYVYKSENGAVVILSTGPDGIAGTKDDLY